MRFSSSDQLRRLRRFAMPNLNNVHLFANGHYPSLTITVSAGRPDGYFGMCVVINTFLSDPISL